MFTSSRTTYSSYVAALLSAAALLSGAAVAQQQEARITFPRTEKPVYNFRDSIVVSWTSPWSGGANLTGNCAANPVEWDQADVDYESTEVIRVPSSGSHTFPEFGQTLSNPVPRPPMKCWFALGPSDADDLPSGTTAAQEPMTTLVKQGNFTMSNSTEPRDRPRLRSFDTSVHPEPWNKLSSVVQIALGAGLGGVCIAMFGVLYVVSMRSARALEDPMNPAYRVNFVPGPNGTVVYKPFGMKPPQGGAPGPAQGPPVHQARDMHDPSRPLMTAYDGRR